MTGFHRYHVARPPCITSFRSRGCRARGGSGRGQGGVYRTRTSHALDQMHHHLGPCRARCCTARHPLDAADTGYRPSHPPRSVAIRRLPPSLIPRIAPILPRNLAFKICYPEGFVGSSPTFGTEQRSFGFPTATGRLKRVMALRAARTAARTGAAGRARSAFGRADLVVLLSEDMRRAAEAGDVEAAEVLHDATGRLLPLVAHRKVAPSRPLDSRK